MSVAAEWSIFLCNDAELPHCHRESLKRKLGGTYFSFSVSFFLITVRAIPKPTHEQFRRCDQVLIDSCLNHNSNSGTKIHGTLVVIQLQY